MKIQIGDKIPDLVFDTNERDGVRLSEVLKGKTVLWVLRYIGCPVCRLDVHRIAQRYGEFTAKGAQVFAVMQSDRAHIEKDLQATGAVLPFEIVCDPEQKIYEELEILPADQEGPPAGEVLERLIAKAREAEAEGFVHGDYEGNEQQLPALFILDETGTALYANYAQDPMDMPSLDEVLEML
ncbi:MAG: AhpC/TSA family protein [Lachnospiraceae bacterium]|nr:AhpC/TSA family protein [Lachnospiraceae bacterium]